MNTNSNNTVFTQVTTTTLKETEKAYQLRLTYWTVCTMPVKTTDIWVPKSCTEVTDGKVTGIAEWILNKWANDHGEYIKRFSHRSADKFIPCFDLAEYERQLANSKAAEQKLKDEFNNTIVAVTKFVTPYAKEQMQRLGYIGNMVCTKYEGTGMLTDVEIAAFKKVAADMRKGFGDWNCTKESSWVVDFVNNINTKCDTLRKLADYLWEEVNFTVFGIDLYRYENRRQIKLADGREISEERIFATIQSSNGQGDSYVGKKFKKNFALQEEFKNIVGTLYNRLNK